MDDSSEFDESDAEQFEDRNDGPVVLETAVNFDELRWLSKIKPRQCVSSIEQVPNLKTSLKNHQQDCFRWQVAAWLAGLPGVLNADEQGLGKTLETISFLSWLKNEMASPGASVSGPVLVVAPTSLLQNWEMEVQQHLEDKGLGHLIRLFGAGLQSKRASGAHGTDIEKGEVKLDLSALHEAVTEGRAHRFWVLTTYTTLANYQHSLGRIKFAAIVFDEIQALKNPASLRAVAARAMQADFRIGLTGTPIENSVIDLWAIMDQLAPGMFESLQHFRVRYAQPDENNMADLYRRVFEAPSGQVPLAIRRIKDEVARDLPAKGRLLHPRLMPAAQAQQYDAARLSLLASTRGMALKVLHHIRTVSVHPSLHSHQGSDNDFVALSARLGATMEILEKIRNNGERVLVFIEHRQMQYRFIALVKAIFGLRHIDLINGDTPIQQRQAIVNKFQSHLSEDGGFDVLVLGPKAAGTGLTLTAATHVIHLSRWWNPAVEEQCNDRVHRIGQTKNVYVHVPLAIHPQYLEHSFDCLLHSLMQRKRRIASSVLWPMGDTEDDAATLQNGLGAEQRGDIDKTTAVEVAMKATFARDGLGEPVFTSDGAISYK
ncbi:DEAD/DEAH box helicase [Neopusillimonas aromaticivorans]|uniref:DEAD/DEAH box helicase n=1 Tax=Neopusillimonas aromaticivorans TaxID=2979868 RepID=UPI0025927E02|nr:DEAD/DEAH box helicase [Neopusillimonas aromaticivorans]WJJ93799.1 DEAD/DEAH box helicase [Neopusillimonas aromaticivorans]